MFAVRRDVTREKKGERRKEPVIRWMMARVSGGYGRGAEWVVEILRRGGGVVLWRWEEASGREF